VCGVYDGPNFIWFIQYVYTAVLCPLFPRCKARECITTSYHTIINPESMFVFSV
jgi:hypothetical protein